LRHLRLRPADALLVSYPKSGSTWLRFLLADALTARDADFDSVRDTIPPLDRYRHAPPLLSGGGKLIRSHEPLAPYHGRPGQRVISLVRDGRDVALSYLAHERRYGRFSGDPREFVDRFLAGRVDPYGPWHEHVQAATDLEASGKARVLRVRYEDLRADTVAELERILAFCGLEPAMSAADLATVVARNSKDQMRAKEASSEFLKSMNTDGTPFVRPDTREGWADLVPLVDRVHFEQVCGPVLLAGGYELEVAPADRGDIGRGGVDGGMIGGGGATLSQPADLSAGPAAVDRAPLDFVVVGAQRAASTHLNACLRGHPDIYMCPDEVPYFEDPFFATTPPAELDAALAGASPDQIRGIQRPDYLARPECPANIRSVAPDARIVAVLRDPVARAVSAYHWYVQFGLLPLLPLDIGMARLLDGWTDPAYPRAGEIIDLGLYGRHLSRYTDTFGADRVRVVLGDDLHDPATFRALYRFLGVAEDHRPQVEMGTNAGAYDLRRLRFLRLRRRLAWSWDDVTTYDYTPRRLRRPVASVISAAVVTVDRVVLARIFTGGSPVLRPDLEQRLRARYADDITLLETLLGRDLAAWRGHAEQIESR